MAKSDTSNFPR